MRQPVIEKYFEKLLTTTARATRPPGRRCGHAEGDAVVDLVADQARAVRVAPRGQRGQFGGVDHRSGRVRRRREHQPGRRLGERLEMVDRRLEARLRAARQLDHVASERGEHVAIGRIARTGHRHRVADVEGGEERVQEPARRPGGHRDVVGRDGDARRCARSARRSPRAAARYPARSCSRCGRRRSSRRPPCAPVPERGRRRLPGRQVDDRQSGRSSLAHRVDHAHDLEGRHSPTGARVRWLSMLILAVRRRPVRRSASTCRRRDRAAARRRGSAAPPRRLAATPDAARRFTSTSS